MSLTDIQTRKAKPQEKRYELTDGKGLTLLVLPSGTKSWVLRYQFEGKARRLTLGQYPSITLAQARNKTLETRIDIHNNIDPAIKKAEAKRSRINAPTFALIIEELWRKELSQIKSGQETKRLLLRDIIPVWGNRKVKDIKRRDIVLLLDEIENRAPITRNRVHGALSRLFNFAAERGIIDDSPCTRIRKVPEKGRSRVLTDEEICKFWHALDLDNKTVDAYRLTKLALKMILLTGQRPGEVIGMRWDEIDQNSGWWNIPPERMKNMEAHHIPLTHTIINILDLAKPLSGESAYVFKSSYKPDDAPMTASTLSRTLRRHWHEIAVDTEAERYTPHDLRRTVRTRLAELGVNDVIAERILAHKLQGIMAVYNHHSYDAEKRHALELWDSKIHQIKHNNKTFQEIAQTNQQHPTPNK